MAGRTYAEPRTVDEAVALLTELGPDAGIVAGGTDLVVGARQGKAPLPESIVAIHRIDALRGIAGSGGGVRLGALVTHEELLAHPVRLAILDILVRRGGEICVCDLEGALPVKQPTVSHHLRLLREAGWIDTVRKGVWAYYFVRQDVVRAVRGRVLRALESLT